MKFRWILMSLLWNDRRTGYEIKKRIDEEFGYFWRVKGPQVYSELKALERLGLVGKEVGPSQRGPERQYYHITDAGRSHLEQEIRILHRNIDPRDEWKALWLVLGEAGTETDRIQYLKDFLSTQHQHLDQLLRDGSPPETQQENSHDWKSIIRDWSVKEVQFQIDQAEKLLHQLSNAPHPQEIPAEPKAKNPEISHPEEPTLFDEMRNSSLL